MITALKISAEGIALCGVASRITWRSDRPGNARKNIAGIMAKYLDTSLATEKVVSAPRVISICLPMVTKSMSLVGSESRSIRLAASLAALVPECIATPTSAWASAGASLVPSPVIATSRPSACSRLMRRSLSSGFASATKSSRPASAVIACAVTGFQSAPDGAGRFPGASLIGPKPAQTARCFGLKTSLFGAKGSLFAKLGNIRCKSLVQPDHRRMIRRLGGRFVEFSCILGHREFGTANVGWSRSSESLA